MIKKVTNKRVNLVVWKSCGKTLRLHMCHKSKLWRIYHKSWVVKVPEEKVLLLILRQKNINSKIGVSQSSLLNLYSQISWVWARRYYWKLRKVQFMSTYRFSFCKKGLDSTKTLEPDRVTENFIQNKAFSRKIIFD